VLRELKELQVHKEIKELKVPFKGLKVFREL
jgi:hypothetical protein